MFIYGFVVSKRVINLGPVHIGQDSPEPRHQPVGIRVICGHCSNTFLVTNTHTSTSDRLCVNVASFFSITVSCYVHVDELFAKVLGLCSRRDSRQSFYFCYILVDRVFRPNPSSLSTLQKSVSVSDFLCQCIKGERHQPEKSWLVTFICTFNWFNVVDFQLIYWSAVPKEAGPDMFPVVCSAACLHCGTVGVYTVSVWRHLSNEYLYNKTDDSKYQ